MKSSVTLYRPVGPKEYQLIKDSGFKKFPPRLPDQPIFYPVISKKYAVRIARDWNVKASGIGYVLEFKIAENFIGNYEVHEVGGRDYQEYWIPAEELEDFNRAIVGKIKLLKTFQKWYVYLVRCADKTIYTGIALDVDKRIKEHNEGKRGAKYTRGRGPVALIKSFEVLSKGEALKLEYQIKKMPKDEKQKFLGNCLS